MKSGRGRLKYADGDTYEGDFRNDLRHGNGVLITKEGEYVG